MSRSRFVWYDLLTTDVKGAIAFYGEVVGWTTEPFGDGYAMWKPAGAAPIGGVMELPKEARDAGAPTHWVGYLATADLDATIEAARARGSRVMHGPSDIPDVGRFAMVADPCGALFAPFQPKPGAEAAPGPIVPGQVAWHELYASDLEKDWAFYSDLFGFQKISSFDMGPMGEYRLFGYDTTTQVGGMMRKPDPMPMSAWTYYFRVANLERSVEIATRRGGKVINGPIEVPGGDRVAQLLDPQGGMFALHVPKA